VVAADVGNRGRSATSGSRQYASAKRTGDGSAAGGRTARNGGAGLNQSSTPR